MSSTSVALVERFYAAVAAGDPTTALEILGRHVDWHEAPGMPYAAEHPYRGAQEVAGHVLGPITADIDALALVNRELIDLGASVVVGRYTGTAVPLSFRAAALNNRVGVPATAGAPSGLSQEEAGALMV